MKEIVLITTKGCEGCAIMLNNIRQALDCTSKKDIKLTIKDKSEVSNKYLNAYRITDFPTVLFFRDEVKLRKEVGSKPAVVVLRWIDIDFK